MTLLDTIRQITKLDRELTIYSLEPCGLSSEIRLAVEGSQEERDAKQNGFRYLIEVFIAQDFLRDWRLTAKESLTDESCCERLIEYAKNDA